MKNKNLTPPKYALRFFRWFCNPDFVEDIEGDLLERFEKNTGENKAAKWMFVKDIIKLFRLSIIRNFEGTDRLNNYGMFKHYLKISYRNLMRRKSFALLNIGGLLMGLTIALLIGLWLESELSFNKDNENYDRVAAVRTQESINGDINNSVSMPYPLSLALENEFSDSFEHVVSSTYFGDRTVSHDAKVINAYGGFMDSGAPDVMSLKMLKGTRNSLSEMGSALLSKSLAKALFGDEDPIGKSIKAHRNWTMTVTGVFEDIPTNSSFHQVNFIGDWDFYEASIQWIDKMSWSHTSFRLYTQLRQGVSLQDVNEKIARVIHNNLRDEDKIYDTKVFLHPMSDWHLRSNWEDGIQIGGDIHYVWWFGIIGAFVLLLACVNFMNLSTAQSIRRAKEVGIRKSIGTKRRQLIAQFLTESTMIVFIAFIFATVVTFFVLPYFNLMVNKEIALPISSAFFWVLGLGFALFIGILSGSYPALYLSSFSPIQILNRTYQNTLSAIFFRKVLIVFQFTIAVILIIGTLIVSKQINHASNRPLGYDKSKIISIRMHTQEHWATNDVFRNELMASGLITHFTQTSAPLTGIWTEHGGISWEGMPSNFQPLFCTFLVNPNFGQTINWEIIEGRDFSTELASDSLALIVNEAAIEYMKLNDPIGKIIRWSDFRWSENFRIVGVVKNLLMESPFSEVRPTIFVVNRGDMSMFQIIKLNPNIPILEAITGIEEIHKKHLQKVPFNFDFVDDLHGRKFSKIKQIGNISQVFAILAILISCLGLFGLVSFMVEQRAKEIGIRKVLGASVFGLLKMLSKEFVLLVIISCAIAIPFGFFGMDEWLNNYEYRIPMDWRVFLFACTITLLIALVTVSFRSMKVVNSNPAKILKDE
jgi:putative ABC transport system permease protein